ncbi:hypothetical protein BKA64DRAFT_548004, partial [Cadophora sp. MPI-SDFR-AT-0126]
NCPKDYKLCSPPGATSTNTPQIDTSEFQNLFINLIQSSLPSTSPKRGNRQISAKSNSASASLCCNALLSCLVMNNTSMPFCYDKFTTNYFLPDGSYGTVVGGAYTSRNGDIVNLETGEYTLVNGEKGNIYPNGSGKPDTEMLPMPTQFTETGVGSAVPASSLGREITVTYTTTLLGMTRSGTTVEPSTGFSIVQETILLPTLISGSTVAATPITTITVPVTIQGTSVSGTTELGRVTTITTVEAVTSSA